MARSQDEIFDLNAVRINVGLSSIIGITIIANQAAIAVKYFSGGSCEIGGASLTWGQGWLLQETVCMAGRGTFYLAAAGSTAVVMVLKGLS